MLKFLITFAVSCVSAQAEWNIHRIRASNPFSVSIGPHLYTLTTKRDGTTLQLFSTNQTFIPCNFSVSLANLPMTAKVLGNQQKIVAWQQINDPTAERLNHTVLLIDPWRCAFQSVPLPEDYLPIAPLSIRHVDVVTYEDGFDVFYPSRKICWPCRFDRNAEKIQLQHQIQTEYEIPMYYYVQPLDGSTPNRGYLYVYVFHNLTTVMRTMDPDFKVLSQLFVDHVVNAVTAKYQNNEQIIVVCYSTPDGTQVIDHSQETRCDRLSTELKSVVSSKLQIPDDYFILYQWHVSLQLDSNGNLHVGALLLSKTRRRSIIRHLFYDPNGKLLGSSTINNFPDNDDHWRFYSYLFGNSMYFIADEGELYDNDDKKNSEIVASFDVIKDH